MRKVSKVIILLMILSLYISNIFGFKEPDFDLYSEATLIYNLDYNQVVYDHNGDKIMYPASITKIMTALVILNNSITYDDEVTITKEMLAGLKEANASCAGYVEGEVVTIKDLLYGLLLPSGADAANALAYYNSGQIDGFVNEMNRMADKLGCTNTQFMNPTGLDDENNYTTANDLVRIFKACLEYPLFKEIIGTAEYTSAPTNKHANGITMKNSDYMLNSDDEYYSPYLLGGKTGFTNMAQRTFISYGKSDNGLTYIIVSLKAPFEGYYVESKAFADQQKLYSWLNDNFYQMTLRKAGEVINKYPVIHGFKRNIEASLSSDLTVLADNETKTTDFTYKERVLDTYEATIAEDQFIGYLVAYDANGVLASYAEMKSDTFVHRNEFVMVVEQLISAIIHYWIQLLVIILILAIIFFVLNLKAYDNQRRAAQRKYALRRLRELEEEKAAKAAKEGK